MQFRGIFAHPMVLPLVLAFLLVNLAVTEYGGTNANSRNATLRAMSESHSFSITRYKDWTIDWSRTPDGQYYSNKAPGPMLIGFPLYWCLDQVTKLFEKGWRDETGRRKAPGYLFHLIFIFSLQVIPYAFLVGLSAGFLANAGASSMAVLFSLLAMLFGNTAIVFINSNFGHGFAAVLVLALALAIQNKNYLLTGLLAGFAVLSDYGVIMQIPAIAAAILVFLWGQPKKIWLQNCSRILVGVIPGAILWIWYHTSCFGSPFALPNKYQNPDFVDLKNVGINLWGVISLPFPAIVRELLIGSSRGVLVTQPYVLVVPLLIVGLWAWQWKKEKKISINRSELSLGLYTFLGFLGLLMMNAGFGGWHGGHAPGPRYMAAIFPCFALWGGLVYDRMGLTGRSALWLCAIISVWYRALVYGHGILVPPVPVWHYLYEYLMQGPHSRTAILRSAIFVVVLAVATVVAERRARTFNALISKSTAS